MRLSIRVRCFLVLLLLSIIGFGPVSTTALIGMYVVITRPPWFLQMVRDIYRNTNAARNAKTAETTAAVASAGTRIRCMLALAVLMIIDIAPIPVVGGIGLWIVGYRPQWFLRLTNRIYGCTHGNSTQRRD